MKEQLKGLVVCGGKGSRLRPLTYTGAKQLVPIANKPIVFYAIEQLVEAGIRDISIIVSPETGEQVRRAIGDGSRFGATIGYIEQPKPGGIAQAIGLARDAMGGAPFVTFLGDNFLAHGIVALVEAFSASDSDAAILVKHVPDATQFGVAQFDGEHLVRVVEKPKDPPSDLAVIGIYMFTDRVWEAIAGIRPSARGELEITDTIQWLLDNGANVSAEVVEGEWIDTGKHDDLLAANHSMLGRRRIRRHWRHGDRRADRRQRVDLAGHERPVVLVHRRAPGHCLLELLTVEPAHQQVRVEEILARGVLVEPAQRVAHRVAVPQYDGPVVGALSRQSAGIASVAVV